MYPRDNSDMPVLRLPPQQQARDDGYYARGRSLPPFIREDATLHQYEENSPDDESETESDDQVIVLPDEQQQDDKESEEEYSDDNAPDDNKVLHFSVDRPEPIRRMVLYLARRFEEMFPKIQGKRRVNPREFDMTLMQLRTMFWNYRRIENNADDFVYVRERVPLRSQFNPSGGYITPKGYYISKQMRDRVRILN
ncbi:hypothetical protein LTR15_009313 [Elasticomyces elasticus]|nr:hypothetical protein LTR15_009313 [Elasticomyces elasticus]